MLLLGRVTQASASTYPSEIGLRLSVSPDSFEEWSGPPRLLGRPLPARPGQSPRQVCHLLAHLSLAVMALLPSEMIAPWAPGTSHIVSRPYPRGSHVRRPTHRRDSYPQRRKALLPACRAQLWPGGFRTHWTTYRISVGIATSFHSDQPCLVASIITYVSVLTERLRGNCWSRNSFWPCSIVALYVDSKVGSSQRQKGAVATMDTAPSFRQNRIRFLLRQISPIIALSGSRKRARCLPRSEAPYTGLAPKVEAGPGVVHVLGQ